MKKHKNATVPVGSNMVQLMQSAVNSRKDSIKMISQGEKNYSEILRATIRLISSSLEIPRSQIEKALVGRLSISNETVHSHIYDSRRIIPFMYWEEYSCTICEIAAKTIAEKKTKGGPLRFDYDLVYEQICNTLLSNNPLLELGKVTEEIFNRTLNKSSTNIAEEAMHLSPIFIHRISKCFETFVTLTSQDIQYLQFLHRGIAEIPQIIPASIVEKDSPDRCIWEKARECYTSNFQQHSAKMVAKELKWFYSKFYRYYSKNSYETKRDLVGEVKCMWIYVFFCLIWPQENANDSWFGLDELEKLMTFKFGIPEIEKEDFLSTLIA